MNTVIFFCVFLGVIITSSVAIAPPMREKMQIRKHKKTLCINAKYFLNLHYFLLFISWKKKKVLDKILHKTCQWLELDTLCYCIPENASSTSTTREAQCNIWKSVLHPFLPVWLFQQDFYCQEMLKKLSYCFYLSINATWESMM